MAFEWYKNNMVGKILSIAFNEYLLIFIRIPVDLFLFFEVL